MWLDEFCSPFAGRACRYVPDGSPYDVLDPRFATDAVDNHWYTRGEATLYFASDHDVLAVEWARHFPADAPVAIGRRARTRRIYDMSMQLGAVLDLRDPRMAPMLGFPNLPEGFLDKERCRSTASRLRRETRADALLVPSIGMLDRTDR